MKKSLKIVLLIFGVLIIGLCVAFLYLNYEVSKYDLSGKQLTSFEKSISYYDVNNNLMFTQSNGTEITKLNDVNDYLKKAFISIEDKRFYKHNGIDYKGLARATFNNVKSLSLKEGASTITQQLVKNTFLSNEKTLKRKAIEMSLSKKIEKKYNKDEILEMYLNTIYFGENCYGITNASSHYFSKKPNDLTIDQCALLAGIVKAPSIYSPTNNPEKCINRRNLVLKEMYNQNYISQSQYDEYKNKPLNLDLNKQNSISFFDDFIDGELDKLNVSPYNRNKMKIYTTIDIKLQDYLNKLLNDDNDNFDKTIVILNKDAKICAISSTCNISKRQIGSTIKPLLVYAPAIESNFISPATQILDEETNFNGYTPSNYGNKFHGYVSVKKALADSLNIPSIKILNGNGVKKSSDFLKKMNFNIDDDDLNLSLGLGAKKQGENLISLANAYTTFMNDGYYKSYSVINSISYKNDLKTSKKENFPIKIYSDDTTFLINDMLLECVKNGTSKKLNSLNFEVCGKTGTVGNSNGNTDAYSISYNQEYCIACWCGNYNNTLLDNTITGGGKPTQLAHNVWNYIYSNKTAPSFFEKPDNVELVKIDKESYNNQEIEIADNNSPERYVIKEYFKTNNLPNKISSRFSAPKIEKPIFSVDNNIITIKLCLTQYYNAKIVKYKNGKKINEYDTVNFSDKSTFVDNINDTSIYEYIIIPYYKNNEQIFFGEEILLDKIKLPTNNVGNDWWKDNF